MEINSIDDIFAFNARVRERLKEVAERASVTRPEVLLDGEKWTAAQVFEHISLVDSGMARICSRLLDKAREAGVASDGRLEFSPAFEANIREIGTRKLEAPEVVHPKGNVSVADSLKILDENERHFEELRAAFASFHSADQTFRHPYFGELNAQEWLWLRGAHEARHTRQIEKLLDMAANTEKGPGYEEGK
ncbi:MAG: DinB family protein [Acidobacteriota bacterium]